MNVEADRRIIDSLLAPHPKILWSAQDAAAAHDLLSGGGPGPVAFECVVYHPATEASPARLQALADRGGQFVAMPAVPSGLCVLVALTDAGYDDMAALAAWWSECCPEAAPSILDLRGRAVNGRVDRAAWEAALYRHLFELTHRDLQAVDGRIASLNGQLYELRMEYGQARRVMQLLQDHLANLRPPYRLIDILTPSNLTYPRGNYPPGSVRQLLPMSAEGLAAIDLYSPAEGGAASGDGMLQVVLQARETASPMATWRIPYRRLSRGWFRCALPVASTAAVHHLELVVTWLSTGGRLPCLALSPVGAFPEVWAVADESPLGGALAYTVWGSSPGARIPAPAPDASVFRADLGSPLTSEYSLKLGDFGQVQATAAAPFNFMHPLSDVPGFRLHPLERALSTAVLRKACIAGTDRVVATAQIRHEGAKYPVEYAMCLTDVDAACAAFPEAPANDRRVVGFSGWQVVPADSQPHTVVLELDKPLDAAADLHFATRMKDGRSIDRHWADWLDVRIRVKSGAVTGCEWPVEERGREEVLPSTGEVRAGQAGVGAGNRCSR